MLYRIVSSLLCFLPKIAMMCLNLSAVYKVLSTSIILVGVQLLNTVIVSGQGHRVNMSYMWHIT